MIPLLPVVIASVAAGTAYLGWRLYQQSPWGPSIQYPLASKIAYPLSAEQRNAAEEADRAMQDMNLPAPIGAAMFANAWSESKLLPSAIGDNGASVGIWQILDKGGIFKGPGYLNSLDERSDPYKSTVAMISFMQDNAGTPTISGATSPIPIADPLTQYAAGERDLGELTAAFMQHVERPSWSQSNEDSRRNHVAQMFPIYGVYP